MNQMFSVQRDRLSAGGGCRGVVPPHNHEVEVKS